MSEAGDEVSKDLEVNIIPERTVEEVEKKAKRFKKAAKEIEEASKKPLFAGVSPLGANPNYGPSTGIPLDAKIRTLQGTIAGIPAIRRIPSAGSGVLPTTGQAPSDIGIHATTRDIFGREITTELTDTRKISGLTGGAPKDISVEELTKNPKKTLSRIELLEQQIKQTRSFTSNPLAWVQDKITTRLAQYPQIASILKIAGVAGIGASFGLEIAQRIADSIVAQFGPGGLWDTRKLVLNNVKTIAPIQQLINIRSGQTFFTDDAGQRLRQGAPEISNTRELRQGHLRYIQLYQGT